MKSIVAMLLPEKRLFTEDYMSEITSAQGGYGDRLAAAWLWLRDGEPQPDREASHLLAEADIPETVYEASLRYEALLLQRDELYDLNQLFPGASPEALAQAREETNEADNQPDLLMKLFMSNANRKSLLLGKVEMHGNPSGIKTLYEVADYFISRYGLYESESLYKVPREIYLNGDPRLSPPHALRLMCSRTVPHMLEDDFGGVVGMGLRLHAQLDLTAMNDEKDITIRDEILRQTEAHWIPVNGVKKFLRHALDEAAPCIYPESARLYVYRKRSDKHAKPSAA